MREPLKRGLLLALAMALAPHTWCADPPAVPPQEEAAGPVAEQNARAYRFDGYLSLGYVYRHAELGTETPVRTAVDRDLYGHLRLDATQPRERRYEWHLLASARRDLDGNQNVTGYYPFEDIGDTGTSASKRYLYEAHLAVDHLFRLVTQLRLGRQAGTRAEPIFFDGVAADMARPRLLAALRVRHVVGSGEAALRAADR